VKETVQEGVTIPVTLTTSNVDLCFLSPLFYRADQSLLSTLAGYELDIETQIVQVQSTVLETQVNVVTNTILGIPMVETETLVITGDKPQKTTCVLSLLQPVNSR